ncbi:MAG: hypothetical protein ACRDCE_00030, partial [Cetobacterium sp.]|uniref:hypothetical protein n=1 Tax=Cetobacterium sp. TaxID=2071632 RepID=UPI003EE4BEAB
FNNGRGHGMRMVVEGIRLNYPMSNKYASCKHSYQQHNKLYALGLTLHSIKNEGSDKVFTFSVSNQYNETRKSYFFQMLVNAMNHHKNKLFGHTEFKVKCMRSKRVYRMSGLEEADGLYATETQMGQAMPSENYVTNDALKAAIRKFLSFRLSTREMELKKVQDAIDHRELKIAGLEEELKGEKELLKNNKLALIRLKDTAQAEAMSSLVNLITNAPKEDL